ncbi:MAG: hypothetical protein K8R54_09450 [Bacteroidales bacterium]|nr:hypothetical protein [Bacteroidales bacterium]
MKRILIILPIIFLYQIIIAQEFNWHAKIEDVNTAGYYKMFLSPDIISQLNHSFPDIRITDQYNNEVQYILKKQKTVYDRGLRKELKIIKNKHKKFKHYTELIIENEESINISNLIFKVVNIHNPVYIKIYGANDQKRWYVLKNSFPVVPEITVADSTEFKVMDIPESKFQFYKVLFHDYDEKPIEVGHVFYHRLSDIRAEYIQLPSPKVSQIDTMGKSIVTVEFAKPEFVDMITFGIKGPEYYLRKVQMRKKDTSSTETSDNEFYDQFRKDFYFGSLKSNRINLYDYKAEKIELIVDNKDNQPLVCFKANAYQLKNYIIAYLKPDIEYYILYGSETASFPSYDLPYFKDTIPELLPETYIYNVKKTKRSTEKEEYIWNFPSQYLWYMVGLLGLVLILISIKLLRERFGNNDRMTE